MCDAEDPEGDAERAQGGGDGSSGWGGYTLPPRSDLQLLRDDDLEELRPVLALILEHRGEIVRQWCQLYLVHFGDLRSLTASEFTRLFEPALEHTQSALLNRDIDEYARRLISLGGSLVERGLPLDEVIASLHLFEQSAQSVLAGQPRFAELHPNPSFDKLSYLQILLLVSAYFSSRSGSAGEYIAALEREAALFPAASRTRFRGLVGTSAAMRQLYRRIEAAAAADNLFIVGERGTERELVARALHQSGPRAGGPFVVLNCAAVPAELIEGELFGYTRGALFDAQPEYLGMFRAADGGTLFVDQIFEAGAATQKKLARVLLDRAVSTFSGAGEQRVDVQFIAASCGEPEMAPAQGRLQEDLLDRLQTPVVMVPPLRDRREDIPLLAEHFIAVFNRRLQRQVAGIERQAMAAMLDHSWPGNVRELGGALERAFVLGSNPVIGLEDLPKAVAHRPPAGNSSAPGSGAGAPVATFAETERELIRRALECTGGNKVHAANLLQISRKKLYAKLEKYSL